MLHLKKNPKDQADQKIQIKNQKAKKIYALKNQKKPFFGEQNRSKLKKQK
jgi:hypothetical protein